MSDATLDSPAKRDRAVSERRSPEFEVAADLRRHEYLSAGAERGLLGPKDVPLGGRFPRRLVEAAKENTGLVSDTELMTYALLRLALEDDFGDRLIARRGRVPKGTFVAG